MKEQETPKKKSREIFLKPLKPRKQGLFRFSTADIETDGLGGEFLDGCIYNGKRSYFFPSSEAMFSHIRDKGGIYYFHNGGRYDLAYLLEYFAGLSEGLDTINMGSSFILAKGKGKKNFEIRDSFAILSSSLLSLCKQFGIQHEEEAGKDKRSKIKEYKRDNPEAYFNYLEQDCISLYKILTSLFSLPELTGVSLQHSFTPASMAMQVFRTKYLDRDVRNYTGLIEDKIRKSYHGGRVEVFNLSEIYEGFLYDITSLYPSVMINEIPYGTPYETTDKNLLTPDSLVDCTVLVDKNRYIGPLPYHYNEKLCFPVGVFAGTWWKKELDSPGVKILNIKNIINFPHKAPLFRSYVEELFSLKARSDGALKVFAKLCLNSLYGKFGMKRDRKAKVFLDEKEGWIHTRNGYNVQWDGGNIYWFEREVRIDAPYIIPHIASYITMLARVKLRQYLEQYQSSIWYCDTDSLVSNKPLPLPISEKLGDWKLEDRLAFFRAYLPKAYIKITEETLEGRTILTDGSKCKGLPGATEGDILRGGKRIEGIESILQSLKGIGEQQVGSFLRKKDTFKSLKAEYDKREILSNGETKPLLIG